MKNLLAIFLGGGLGSLARFGISRIFSIVRTDFPAGTFAANVLACIVLGTLTGYALAKGQMNNFWKHFLVIGFCGGFSTFSTFSSEGFALFESNKLLLGLFYILLSVSVCFGGIWLGQMIGKQL